MLQWVSWRFHRTAKKNNKMKNLLVAIDFSKNAFHALEYAMLYARRFQADINMIWVDNYAGPELLVEKGDGESRHESRQLFKEIVKKFEKKHSGVKLSYKLSKGKVFEEISKYAQQLGSELIFTGTHGVTGFEEYWIGSNAYRIVTHAPCPVITLRQHFDFGNEIKKILLPVDSSLQSGRKVYTAAKVAAAFNAEIIVNALHTSSLGSLKRQVDKNLKTISDHLQEEKLPFVVNEFNTQNITQHTIDFALENKVDLVAIMTDQETTQANVFLGAFARQLVNNCPVPVLNVRVTDTP
jgi:nucleotide-binding universal stress UspA family protein